MTLTDKIKKNWARAAGAVLAGISASYALRGAFDISRFQNYTWETDPLKAGTWIGGTMLAAGLTYALGPKIVKETKKARKKLGKLGCIAAGVSLTGLLGLGYVNHNVTRIGAWDPVKTAQEIGTVLDSENPIRKRNEHFIDTYVLNSPIDGCRRSDAIRFPEGIELYDNGVELEKGIPGKVGPPTYTTRRVLKTPTGNITLFDYEMKDHPDFKHVGIFSPGDFNRTNSYNQRIDQYPLQLILSPDSVIRAEATGLTGTVLACRPDYGTLYTAEKITFTDLATGEQLFGGPLENITVPAQGPLHYDETLDELTLQFYKDNEVRVRTIDGIETVVAHGKEHCDKYGYAFEAQLR